MSKEPQRVCSICGNEFAGAMEFCLVCLLRKGLADGVESGESSSEETRTPTSQDAVQRFERYELVTGEDGKTVELGRGAMGITLEREGKASSKLEDLGLNELNAKSGPNCY
jgi:hypothetical protein